MSDDSYIDYYCERMSADYWAEPWNALTNAAFLLSALLLFVLLRFTGQGDWRAYWLTALVFLMGVGSYLFHTHASVVTKWADVIPILLFQLSFIIFYCRDVMMRNLRQVMIIILVFIGLSVLTGAFIPYDFMNGSASYLPAWLFILWFGAWQFMHINPGKRVLAYAAFLFTLSLVFRSVDNTLCEVFTTGTHFIWHILNAVVLYLAVRAYVIARSVILRPDASMLQENELLGEIENHHDQT